MNPWQILGIEPTQDKKEIKKAYAKLTKQYHPEENPEKFKQLQEAYQACLHADFKEERVDEEIQKVEPIHVDDIQEDSTIVPPKIPRKDTLFSEEKDVSVYQTLLNEINKKLPKKIGEKEV